ncbi:MAG: hypothetical protein ABFD59_11440 [Smithella sp.]
MAIKKQAAGRISKKIELPSPTLQAYLKKIIFDDEEYLIFLEDIQGSLNKNGMQLDPKVTANLMVDFRLAVGRAREALTKKGSKLKFENVFGIPVVEIANGKIKIKQRSIGADTTVDVYYSETKSEENRGRSTQFDPKVEALTRRETESYHTTKFDGSSIFPGDREQLFQRTPLLSVDVLKQIVVNVKKV